MASLFESTYNPDVLSCLANLSNDEVFTPPELANQMLDMLPEELWSDPNATFLDPACKSGVFLREIAKRLIDGLEEQIPDLQERLDHIYKYQLFGIAITELTSLLSRRSLYCSKYPNSKYSVVAFDGPEGNVRFRSTEHDWYAGRCRKCGASQKEYERDEALEQHAYEFIHLDNPEEVLNMKFDVVIGNPPYQLGSNDTRSTSRDRPIYNLFVEQAKKLMPRFLVMIIPSRWMASGLGLGQFRQIMLSDARIRKMVDYPVASEVFPGVEIKGGVCYFLWNRDSSGPCEVVTIRDQSSSVPILRRLDEYDVFVRDSRALPILDKVLGRHERSIVEILSADKEFGWTSNFDEFQKTRIPNGVPLFYNRSGKRLQGWIARSKVIKSANLIDAWKVMVPSAGSDGGQRIPDAVIGRPFVAPSPSVCTQTYLFFSVSNEREANSLQSYISTKFVRYLISLRKITQHATRSTYGWVPIQSWDRLWTDKELYEKYGLDKDEQELIEYMIKPMDLGESDA